MRSSFSNVDVWRLGFGIAGGLHRKPGVSWISYDHSPEFHGYGCHGPRLRPDICLFFIHSALSSFQDVNHSSGNVFYLSLVRTTFSSLRLSVFRVDFSFNHTLLNTPSKPTPNAKASDGISYRLTFTTITTDETFSLTMTVFPRLNDSTSKANFFFSFSALFA